MLHASTRRRLAEPWLPLTQTRVHVLACSQAAVHSPTSVTPAATARPQSSRRQHARLAGGSSLMWRTNSNTVTQLT
jgi:hypothetical protein